MAGINVGTAWVTIAASAKGIGKSIEKDLKGAGTKAGAAFGTEFDKSASKSASAMSSFGSKAIVGAAAVGAAFYGLASAAGDLSAAVAANEQVLGSASDAVQDFAAAGVENVGLSETAVLNAATAFGQLGKIVGLTGGDLSDFSTDLVTASADMAAFKNNTPTEALGDLQSAFAGQPEVLRKYGIFLDEASLKQAYLRETGETVTGSLSAQQRIVATNSEIWRQGADMWGQAARESDGLERSVADLKGTVTNAAADFGTPIVGFASGLIGAVTDGIGGLQDFNTQTGGMLATGLAASVGISAAGAAAFGIASKVKGAVDAFSGLSKGMKIATSALGGVALGVAAGFVAYGLLTEKSRQMAARTKEVSAALDTATDDAWEYAAAAAGTTGEIDGFAVAQRALSIALTSTGEDGEALTQALGSIGQQAEDAFGILMAQSEDPIANIARLGREAGLSAEHAQLLAEGMAATNDASRRNEGLYDWVSALDLGAEAEQSFLQEIFPLVDGLELIEDQANPEILNELATEFLNSASASSESAEALVDEAEARAAANDTADSSVDTYNELMGLLGEMTPAQRDAALAALDIAQAQGDAAAAGAEMNSVAASSIDMTTDLDDALADAGRTADAFSDAIDRLIGGQLGYQESTDDLAAGVAELDEQIRLAQEGEEGYELSLDGSTDAGRDNREMIRSRVTDILGMADAELEAGHGIDAAAVALQEQRNALIAQIAPFFETTQAAEDYVNQLGLTPEAVVTAVLLSQEDQSRQALEEYIALAGDVPESEVTSIQAMIDDGAYDLAMTRLEYLARQRWVKLTATTGGGAGGQNLNGPIVNAYGGYYSGNNPTLSWIGEAPWDEAVLTLGNVANLRRQLMDDRISGPILDALPRVDPMGSDGGSGRRREGDININSYEQNPTPSGLATALRMARV